MKNRIGGNISTTCRHCEKPIIDVAGGNRICGLCAEHVAGTANRRINPRSRQIRILHLQRERDISGVSGLGTVAYGVEFPDGTVVLRWDTLVNSTTFYNSIADLEAISGHGGATKIVIDQEIEVQ